MHLPDGSLSPPVWIAGDALAFGMVALCVRLATRAFSDRRVPLMGVLGAFVFAAQMINFPLPGGTSGHLIGAVLLARLLGPATGSVVMFCVLLIQSLLFQDGGITVLGSNWISMGLLGSFGGWLIAKAFSREGQGLKQDAGVFVACFVTVLAGAWLTTLQLWLSGNAPLVPALVTMGSLHALVGAVEGAITVAALRFLYAARPELLEKIP